MGVTDGGHVIDMAKVGAILRETREVAEVLAPIYEDEDSVAVLAVTVDPEPAGGRFGGLDPDHARLLEALCWPSKLGARRV